MCAWLLAYEHVFVRFAMLVCMCHNVWQTAECRIGGRGHLDGVHGVAPGVLVGDDRGRQHPAVHHRHQRRQGVGHHPRLRHNHESK